MWYFAVGLICLLIGYYRGVISSAKYICGLLDESIDNDCYVEIGGVDIKAKKRGKEDETQN